MPITSYDPQPTGVAAARAPETAAGQGSSRRGAPRSRATPDGLADGPVDRVGIVFVHGIGTQTAGETFLDWSRPLIELLGEWEQARHPTADPSDPVVRSRFSFHPANPPILELAIPAAHGRRAGRWLITEAWWAADLRAPGFDEATSFLRRRLARIVTGVRDGYDELVRRRRRRRSAPAEARAAARGTSAGRSAGSGGVTTSSGGSAVGARVVATDPAPSGWRWVDRLDAFQAHAFALVATIPLAALGVGALAVYALVRRVPLGPIRRFAEFRILDSFLIEWFGDLSVLLGDAAQAANVRARVVDAIDRLYGEGAEAIVLVAHSGGAIVSFETLADAAYLDRPVAKLVTFGEGLKLAWALADERQDEHLTARARLAGDLRERPRLRWTDIWASYDPAPAGGLPSRDWLLPAEPDDVERLRREHPDRTIVEDRPVTNRMNVLRDHGAYWQNAEGFLVPLVRHLDDPLGDGARSRFFRSREGRWDRIERRRQRVGVLAAWDWLASGAGASAALLLLAVDAIPALGQALPGQAGRLGAAGDGIARIVGALPGGDIVAAPVDAFGSLLGWLVRGAAGAIGGPDTVAGAGQMLDGVGRGGPGLLGLLLIAALVFALATGGNGRWARWDRDEGRRSMADPPRAVDRGQAWAEAALLIGGLAALWGAIVVGSAALVAALVGVGIVASVAIRLRRSRAPVARTTTA